MIGMGMWSGGESMPDDDLLDMSATSAPSAAAGGARAAGTGDEGWDDMERDNTKTFTLGVAKAFNADVCDRSLV